MDNNTLLLIGAVLIIVFFLFPLRNEGFKKWGGGGKWGGKGGWGKWGGGGWRRWNRPLSYPIYYPAYYYNPQPTTLCELKCAKECCDEYEDCSPSHYRCCNDGLCKCCEK